VYRLFFIENYGHILISEAIGSKLIHHGKVLLWNLIFYMGESDKYSVDMGGIIYFESLGLRIL